MNKPKISIILPTLNEEETIGKVIDEIPRSALEQAGYVVHVLVVDGNSTDSTRQIAEQKGATVMIEPRKGKGTAVTAALKSVDGDFIFTLDGDYTYPATYIPEMLALLGNNPVVIGSRLKGKREKGAMSRLNTLGNHILSLIATVLYQRRISDVCTGYWGFRAEVLKDLGLIATGFELEAELFSQLTSKGYSIAEIPIYYRRRAGHPKLNPLKDGVKIAWRLVNKRIRRLVD